jgi:hypothetical protein
LHTIQRIFNNQNLHSPIVKKNHNIWMNVQICFPGLIPSLSATSKKIWMWFSTLKQLQMIKRNVKCCIPLTFGSLPTIAKSFVHARVRLHLLCVVVATTSMRYTCFMLLLSHHLRLYIPRKVCP